MKDTLKMFIAPLLERAVKEGACGDLAESLYEIAKELNPDEYACDPPYLIIEVNGGVVVSVHSNRDFHYDILDYDSYDNQFHEDNICNDSLDENDVSHQLHLRKLEFDREKMVFCK